MDDRGPVLFEYKPLSMSPMTVAELLLLIVVTAAAPFALPSDFFPLGGACFLPLAGVFVWAVLQRPSPTRIHTAGIEVSLPAWRRTIRERAYFPWSAIRNVYPASYEISGAAMSPFASSAGTLVHTGLGLETHDGRRRTVRFTPGTIRAFRTESPGFTYAMAAVREAFRMMARPLVSDVVPYSDAEVLAMHEEARQPLLGLDAIVYAFFLPPAIVAAMLLLLVHAGVAIGLPVLIATIGLALIPPLSSMGVTLAKSRRRNWVLSELAKHEEAARSPPKDANRRGPAELV